MYINDRELYGKTMKLSRKMYTNDRELYEKKLKEMHNCL